MRKTVPVLRALFIACVLSFSAQVWAQGEAETAACVVSSSNDRVVILVCNPDLDYEALRGAGKSACANALGICNAWMWDDAEVAPDRAPATDADLDEDKVRQAVAVWIHDSSRLLLLKKKDKAGPAT